MKEKENQNICDNCEYYIRRYMVGGYGTLFEDNSGLCQKNHTYHDNHYSCPRFKKISTECKRIEKQRGKQISIVTEFIRIQKSMKNLNESILKVNMRLKEHKLFDIDTSIK